MSDKATKSSIERIKDYLDRRAATDSQFAAAYAKPQKTIDGCIAHICAKVRKSGKTMLSDDEVFGWAVDYYDEDTIKDEKMPAVRIVSSTSQEQDAPTPKSSRRKGRLKEPPHEPYVQLSLFD